MTYMYIIYFVRANKDQLGDTETKYVYLKIQSYHRIIERDLAIYRYHNFDKNSLIIL